MTRCTESLAEEWLEIKSLLLRLENIPSEERECLLARVCDQRPCLEGDLRYFLRPQQDIQDFLETPVCDLLSGPKEKLAEGDFVGPYRLGEQIGQGGVGIVFRTSLSDASGTQPVAIKILRRKWRGTVVEQSFRREGALLCSIKHGGVVRGLEVSDSSEPVPYIVMEYLSESKRIDEYCRDKKPGFDEIARLLFKVTSTLEALHGESLLHCDVKPGNIMVKPSGEVILIDFGLAARLERGGRGCSLDRRWRFCTPGFASPELLAGGPITQASDVFMLGRTLWRLLEGSTCDHEKKRQSIFRQCSLEGGLREISLRACSAIPRERYQSAGMLKRALQKCLNENVFCRAA